MRRFVLLAVVCATAFAVARSASADLVAMWLLDEGKGGDIKDSSGNGHDGAIEGKADWTDGKFEKALAFGGGRVHVKTADDLNLMQWSLSVWVKVKAATATYQMVAGKEGWPNRNYSMWILPTVMTFGFTSGANDIQTQVGDVVDDKWHHLVGAYDQKNLYGFIDGALVKQVPAGGKPNTCDCPFFIGAQPAAGGGPLMGSIDEVAVYSHALTEKEVATVMKGLKSNLAVSPQAKVAVVWANLRR